MASRARPHKPPSKELSRRKAAALGTGGGKLPPRLRDKLDEKPTPKRVRAPRTSAPPRLRAGKREPRAGRHNEAADR